MIKKVATFISGLPWWVQLIAAMISNVAVFLGMLFASQEFGFSALSAIVGVVVGAGSAFWVIAVAAGGRFVSRAGAFAAGVGLTTGGLIWLVAADVSAAVQAVVVVLLAACAGAAKYGAFRASGFDGRRFGNAVTFSGLLTVVVMIAVALVSLTFGE